MLNLRKLFDKYRIQWRDKGANCARQHVNVACPWCGNLDHGYHLSISEDGLGYYCFRNPDHAGRSLAVLFSKLKIPRKEYANEKVKKVVQKEYVDTNSYSAFNYFEQASANQEAIGYLRARNFTDPVSAAAKFNLKADTIGKWAGRLIIPLTVGWTGRAMRPEMEPRYLSHTTTDGFFCYSQNSATAVIVEGAIDAMRIATVTIQVDLIAKCGNRLSPGFLYYLRSKGYRTIINSPDTEVPYEQYEKETRLLRAYSAQSNVKLFRLGEFKDWGTTTESEARQLVRGL